MVNQGVNDVAGEMGIPGAADGVIDKGEFSLGGVALFWGTMR